MSTVSYMLAIREEEPIQGSIRVISGASGLSLYESVESLELHLDDGRCLTIIIQTPIDLTDDSWHIAGSGSMQPPKRGA
ncbi:MAG: hypothetical protein H6658_05890 [Ardenticatenaceae bacterium]|nr:hypothetical protein [Ardenticatenaceae bacterium]